MRRQLVLLPILFGFFVMGFADIISTALIRIEEECRLSAFAAAVLPLMIFVWFLLISIPTGILCGKIGRKNTVLASLALTVAAMFLPFAATAERWWIYAVSFAFLGIGNTMIQAALPALMSNVVPQEKLTARISLGQFVKALCAAATPVVALFCAERLGNWKYLFLVYGALTFVAAAWLALSPIPRERASAAPPSFASCVRQLASPYILAMVVGVFFSVAADIGFAVGVPEYLRDVFRLPTDKAATGPSVYFLAKMLAAFAGSIVFARISAARCFPWSVGLAVGATAGLFFAPNPTVFLVLVFLSSFGFANTFGMCMGLAINHRPERTNEISALVVMAISGGGLVKIAFGALRGSLGPAGIVWTLLACLVYLLALGVFATRSLKGTAGGRP